MPQKITEIVPGYYYHIYNRAVDRIILFREKNNYAFFTSKIKKYLPPVSDVLAYCLMPNHYHLLVRIRDANFPRSMQKLALSYVVPYNKNFYRKGHLFQGRYQKKHIQHFDYLLRLSAYIHRNPATANIVKNPEDWEYSSYKEYIGHRKQDFVNVDIILNVLCDDLTSTIREQQNKYKEYVDNNKGIASL
jgi:REP element-mobilizing transposase RayT